MSSLPSRGDSGRTSIAGFLYQWLALAAFRAGGEFHGLDDYRAEIDALFSVAGSAEILSEAFDQDGLLLQPAKNPDESEGILIQCKYTRVGTTTIDSVEMAAIISTLDKAQAREATHAKKITAYVLITNRHLTGPARENGRLVPLPPNGTPIPPATVPPTLFLVEGQLLEKWVNLLDHFGRALGCFPNEIEIAINVSAQ
jgi:hypothetical protein